MRRTSVTGWAILSVAAFAAFIVAEVAFRLVVGDKLLFHADPEIEYVPQADQAVRRRGVDMRTNAWGMRSPPVEREKPAGVFRVLVIGDSIVFGYTNINHDDLATTRLSGVTAIDGKRVEALNISSSSWGPGNMLAWLDRNGLFGANAAVLVLSSHDLTDDRTFTPPERDAFPQSRPLLALPDWLLRKAGPGNSSATVDPRSVGDAERSLARLFSRLAALPSGACLIVHATQEEQRAAGFSREAQRLAELGSAAGLFVVHDDGALDASADYADGIHLSMSGQARHADIMASCAPLANTLGTR